MSEVCRRLNLELRVKCSYIQPFPLIFATLLTLSILLLFTDNQRLEHRRNPTDVIVNSRRNILRGSTSSGRHSPAFGCILINCTT